MYVLLNDFDLIVLSFKNIKGIKHIINFNIPVIF